MKQALTVKELATKIVGDGKKPNKYFVTIGYGWYRPFGEDAEMIQAKNSLDSESLLFTNKTDAEDLFYAIALSNQAHNGKITGETIGQVMIEDRLTGVIKEKCLRQRENGTFFVDTY